MKIYIYTQCYENYGYRWKPKGGMDYFIPCGESISPVRLDAMVSLARLKIEHKNEMFEENIVGIEVVADDFMTDFEENQLKYDGKIDFPARIVNVLEG
jgi:hypothetical protein